MIPVRRIGAPAVLTETGRKGPNELARVVGHYERGDPAQRPEFKAFKDPEVKAALHQMFGGKCAYCESRYDNTAPMDVEHYRPKGQVRQLDGSSVAPGYYGLAASWENLLPSCIDCNRGRTQQLVADDGARHSEVSGKEALFPLPTPLASAPRRGRERREKPLLLNPCEPDIRLVQHLEFTDDGLVRPTAHAQEVARGRGDATIEVCGLTREGLVAARRRRIVYLKKDMKNVVRAAAAARRHPDDAEDAAFLEECWQALEGHLASDDAFLAVTRQLIASFRKVFATAEAYNKAVRGLDDGAAGAESELARQMDAVSRRLDASRPDHALAREVFGWCGIDLPND